MGSLEPGGSRAYLMPTFPTVTRIAQGICLVVNGDTREIVYVAGPAERRWAFWKGRVYQSVPDEAEPASQARPGERVSHALTAPMPATVIKVLVAPGTH